MQTQTISFEEGLSRLENAILTTKRKPIIISIHGVPNSGKTELRIKLVRKLSIQHKVNGASGMRGDSLDKMCFYSHESPQYVLFEDMVFTAECEEASRELFGREQDIKIYIARRINTQEFYSYCERFKQKYDMIITNPDAKNKNKPY